MIWSPALPEPTALCYTRSVMDFFIQLITFPFRLIGKITDLIGRTVVLLVGFAMMVLGVALLELMNGVVTFAIPLFIVGLLLVLRALT